MKFEYLKGGLGALLVPLFIAIGAVSSWHWIAPLAFFGGAGIWVLYVVALREGLGLEKSHRDWICFRDPGELNARFPGGMETIIDQKADPAERAFAFGYVWALLLQTFFLLGIATTVAIHAYFPQIFH